MELFDVTDELRQICKEIVAQDWSSEEWAEHEAGDWFQTENYCGGWEDGMFGFGYFGRPNEDYWFELSLDEAARVAKGLQAQIRLYRRGESPDSS